MFLVFFKPDLWHAFTAGLVSDTRALGTTGGSTLLSDYEPLATGRKQSLFAEELESIHGSLSELIQGSRVAVIGAAGSIGFSVVKSVLAFRPRGLVLIDLSESNLVEVVRELRSSQSILVPKDFATLPIGLGSIECRRYFCESKPFDYILNLCALKHVRSEKDLYCIIRMLDTNVLFLAEFLEALPYTFRKFFSVSSDKAANPANLMGASKMAMELMLQHQPRVYSTARFANVAFSDGSLPHGFLQRLEKQQPISAPKDVRRYFISHEEAGQICLLSCILGENRDVYFPRLEQGRHEKRFSEIAVALLEKLGYEPVVCSSEQEARQRASELISQKRWPCWFFQSSTTGEKPFEEFHTSEEKIDLATYKHIGVIKRSEPDDDPQALRRFLEFARAARGETGVTKADYVREISRIVPGLEHLETGRNLDQRM